MIPSEMIAGAIERERVSVKLRKIILVEKNRACCQEFGHRAWGFRGFGGRRRAGALGPRPSALWPGYGGKLGAMVSFLQKYLKKCHESDLELFVVATS